MASSISNFLENTIMNMVFNDTDPSFTGAVVSPATLYVKLHTGAPGEDGTGFPATNTTRQAASFGAAANGVSTSDADIQWLLVPAETYTAISIWDSVGPAGGNCIWFGDLTSSKTVALNDTFTIPSGSLTVTLD